jgi:hypothetical protein
MLRSDLIESNEVLETTTAALGQMAMGRRVIFPTTFYENWQAVKTESSQWFPARKRFNLLFAAHCLDDPGRSEHGIGSRGGIFSGSRVKTVL